MLDISTEKNRTKIRNTSAMHADLRQSFQQGLQ